MKFLVTMKDPDTLTDSIEEAVTEHLKSSGLSSDEQEALIKTRTAKVFDRCCTWFKYGEYLCVEVDTDANTCTVKET